MVITAESGVNHGHLPNDRWVVPEVIEMPSFNAIHASPYSTRSSDNVQCLKDAPNLSNSFIFLS